MSDISKPDYLKRPDGQSIAYHHSAGKSPGVIFCPGFMSDMDGTKATALESAMQAVGRSYTRFDYFGHGQSTGIFADGCLSHWIDDALAILDECTAGPQVVVGSSMGGWVGLRMAQLKPERIHGFVGIAAAPDFTKRMAVAFTEAQKAELEDRGYFEEETEYGDDPYIITKKLIDDGNRNFVLERQLDINCPVHLLHGMKDASVPWQTPLDIQEALTTEEVIVTLTKNGDHRLSEPEDIDRLVKAVCDMCEKIEQ
jgi:pimeloyl-ACP methyl ester carboxylesterase